MDVKERPESELEDEDVQEQPERNYLPDQPVKSSISGGGSAGGFGLGKIGGFGKKNKRKIAVAGIVASAISGLVVLLFFGLVDFKLIHLREVMDQYFGSRSRYAVNHRMGKIWQAVEGRDGSIHYERDGKHLLRDHIYNVNSEKIVADLKGRGINASLDPNNKYRLTIDGQSAGKTLGDRQSALRKSLEAAYPNENYFKRSLRAKRVFKLYGVSGSFFAKAKDSVKQRIRERLVGKSADALSASQEKLSGDKAVDDVNQKAIDDLQHTIGDQAKELQHNLLTNPTEEASLVKANVSPEELSKVASTAAVKSAFNVTYALSQVCNIKNLMKEITIAAKIYRSRSEVRYAGTILVAADQLKTGKDTTGDQVNDLMKSLGNIEESGGFKRASGLNPNAPITTADKYSLDLTKASGGGAFFAKLDKNLDSIPGAGNTCKVVTNVVFQIGATAATVVGSFFTGGGLSLGGVASSAAVSFSIGAVESVLKPMAIQMLAGFTVTGDEPGSDKGDALFAGSDIIYNQNARSNGGRKLSPQEVSQLNEQIAQEDGKNRTLADSVFNLHNPKSLVARLAFATPSSPGQAATSFASFTARLNPFNDLHAITQPNGLLAQMSGAALADPPTEDPFGVDQYGLTTNDMDDPLVSDPVANEAYILGNADIEQQYKDYVSKCFTPTESSTEDTICSDSSNGLYRRFRVYQLDKGLAGGIDYMTNASADLPDDDTAGATP